MPTLTTSEALLLNGSGTLVSRRDKQVATARGDLTPGLPIGHGTVTIGGTASLVTVLVMTLAPLLGGLAGMRTYCEVDTTGLGA